MRRTDLIGLFGCAVGVGAAVSSAVLLAPLFVCAGFFEQGCGAWETLSLLGLSLVAISVGGFIGFFAAALASKLLARK